MSKEILEKVIGEYETSSSPIQNMFYNKIKKKEIRIHLSKNGSSTDGKDVYIDFKKYKSNHTIKVILNHEITHTIQDKSHISSFLENIPAESHFFTQLLTENHAYLFQQVAMTYKEIKNIKKQLNSRELSTSDIFMLGKTQQFYNFLTRMRKELGAKPKEILTQCVQVVFLNEFTHSEAHLKLYKKQTKQMKSIKVIPEVKDTDDNIKVFIKMLGDLIPITLRSFPFPDDPEMQEALKKEDLDKTIDVFDDNFLEKCVERMKDSFVMFDKEGKMLSFEGAMENFKKITQQNSTKIPGRV
ncbi:MAG: hypothetical protein ACTSXL_03100 [Alphaproteobacteria bacterium]